MRSALRGPTPGSLPRAAIRAWMGSGSAATMLHYARDAQALRDLAHFRVGNFLGLADGVIDRADQHLFQNLRIIRIEGGGINLDGGNVAVAFGRDFDSAAAA